MELGQIWQFAGNNWHRRDSLLPRPSQQKSFSLTNRHLGSPSSVQVLPVFLGEEFHLRDKSKHNLDVFLIGLLAPIWDIETADVVAHDACPVDQDVLW